MARRIDVHHHILPQHYVEQIGAGKIGAQGSSGKMPFWSASDALAKMDEQDIGTAITSVSAPGLDVPDAGKEAELARWCNEFAATLGHDHPGRFGMFAAMPLRSVDAALRETEHAFDTLHADGVCLLSNHCGLYLGDSYLHPLYEELNRRSAVVFVHPTSPAEPVPVANLSASSLDFTFDTARAIVSLIFTGTLLKFPNMRFIFSHMGGALPYIADRIEVLSRNNPELQGHIPDGIRAVLRKCYFDTALSANSVTFAAMMQIGSEDNILFGTDYPFGPKDQMADAVRSLARLSLTEAQRSKIESGNAQVLFPRFAA
ncbi:amidohydrolase [Candidimonas humi]|uniref:Amidohydrolase family protein n=1 Tax=Candidimonas humi TaxID=683355 RepID=A0ABV8NY73_9BURK|nr:amidohydrolase family protein [Candidimonas humi]MBV6305625.1 amidohydrolase [Candidimonas humi]